MWRMCVEEGGVVYGGGVWCVEEGRPTAVTLVCETLSLVHTHLHMCTICTHTHEHSQMVREQKGRLLELTRSKQEMMDQLQVRGDIPN